MKTYKNRYGVEYGFELIEPGLYRFNMDPKEMQFCRFGGKPNQEGIDNSDLGFFDPSGGPFIQVGMQLEDGTVTRIALDKNILIFIE